MKKKGQSAVEFLILIGAILFFFVAFLYMINLNISDKLRENKDLTIQEIAFQVQDEINLAHESVDGYYRKFELPLNVLGSEYEINVTAGVVYVRTTNGKHAIALPVVNVTGDVLKGTNVIQKNNGVVLLNT